MGFRFRKSIRLFPGVRLNLSKSGASTSIGPRGLTMNVKPGRKTRVTASIPGTGISYSESVGDATEHVARPESGSAEEPPISGTLIFLIGLVVLLMILFLVKN